MKRFLLALAVTGISANAWADNNISCSKLTAEDSNCERLGYVKKASECNGVPTLVCPFDTDKVFCGHKTECDVGDVLYYDGRCYGDLPVPKKDDGHFLDPIGVVVDPQTRLAVLPASYAAGRVWQSYGSYYSGTNPPPYTYYMHSPDACLNSSEDYWVNFPVPTSPITVDACGIPSGTSTSFNWDISPLLQKILSPLRNFTPIKSAHAASTVTYTLGCAIPYVATNQTDCTSVAGQNRGGKFYTEQLMNFQSANSGTLFTVRSSSSVNSVVQGITFPAADYCYNLDIFVSNGEQFTPIRPFLPSVGDLYKMFDADNRLAVFNGLIATDASCSDVGKFTSISGLNEFYNSYEGDCSLYTDLYLAHTTGWWSSQQFFSRGSTPYLHTTWNKALRVRFNESPELVIDSLRSENAPVLCFINY